MRSLRLSTLVISFLLGLSSGPGVAGEAELARFRKEYPPAARALEVKYARIKGTGKMSFQRGNRPANVSVAYFSADHSARKIVLEQTTKVGLTATVDCLSDTSSFRLSRPKKDAAYKVIDIGTAQEVRPATAANLKFLTAPYAAWGYSLPEYMKVPKHNFVLKSAENVIEGGRSLMAVDYTAGRMDAPSRFRVVLDPSLGWVMRSAEIRSEPRLDYVMRSEVEYDPAGGEAPWPRTARFNAPGVEVSTFVFEKISSDATPEVEFTLPFYNLPNAAAPAPSTRAYVNAAVYWLFGAAVLGTATTYLLHWIAGSSKRLS